MKYYKPLAFALCMLVSFYQGADAQWADTQRNNVSILTSGDRGSQLNAIAGVYRIEKDKFDGYAALYFARATADDETLSEVLNSRVEGGYSHNHLGIYGYIAGDSNLDKATRSVRLGYYGKWYMNRVVSLGVGNWAKTQADIDEVLGAGASAGASDGVSFGWEANINASHGNLSAQLKILPELTGEYLEARFTPAYTTSLGTIGNNNDIEVGITINGLVDYISDAKSRGASPISWSYSAGMNFLF